MTQIDASGQGTPVGQEKRKTLSEQIEQAADDLGSEVAALQSIADAIQHRIAILAGNPEPENAHGPSSTNATKTPGVLSILQSIAQFKLARSQLSQCLDSL